MADVRAELAGFGMKIAAAGLVAGAGGNISARSGRIVWMKPSGLAMDDMSPDDLCGIDLETGAQISGGHKPTSEFNMHLAVYRARPDVKAVFHTHSPWASGAVTAGVEFKALSPLFALELGRVATIPYITPTTKLLAGAAARAARAHDTIFMVNHGVLATGSGMRQAFRRCLAAENEAIAVLAASVAGRPRFLSKAQQAELGRLRRRHST